MKIVSVIPIAKGVSVEALSYFSSQEVSPGDLVTVELRKKEAKAIAVKVEEVGETKEEIKSSPFALKKIKSVEKNNIFYPEFIRAINPLVDWYISTHSALLQSLLPSKVLATSKNLKNPKEREKDGSHQSYVVQSDDNERYGQYKGLIRESLARKKSIFFIVPSRQETIRAYERLKKGVEGQTHIIHNDMTGKQIAEAWNKILNSEKNVLVITTGKFALIPRHDLGTIILERESSKGYKKLNKPYLNIRKFVEGYAKELGIRFVLGDTLLSVSTLNRYKNNELFEYSPLTFRILSPAENSLVDMRKYKSSDKKSGESFQVLSEEVKEMIAHCRENNENIFIFAGRRGLSPSVLCGDCNTVVTCDTCSAPIVLHGADPARKGNYFKCHVCGDERHSGEKCKHCNSWNLKTLGIGTETIEKAILEEFPDQNILRIDSDTSKTPRQAEKQAEKFFNSTGSVCIGTEMALFYLHEEIDHVAVASIDSLFSLPDFRIRERIAHILLTLRGLATSTFTIQTRYMEDDVFKYVLGGNMTDFYKEEIDKRQKFHYPPFARFIKLTRIGDKEKIEKEMKELQDFFKPVEMHYFEAFTGKVRGKNVLNGLIRLHPNDWINQVLLKKLKMLPPYYRIEVDAEDLL